MIVLVVALHWNPNHLSVIVDAEVHRLIAVQRMTGQTTLAQVIELAVTMVYGGVDAVAVPMVDPHARGDHHWSLADREGHRHR